MSSDSGGTASDPEWIMQILGRHISQAPSSFLRC